jgi:hypothetical protein
MRTNLPPSSPLLEEEGSQGKMREANLPSSPLLREEGGQGGW